jgi:alkylation response protein AidB-like acyl-CoA dehydrogenase
MLVPASLGGGETDLITFAQAIEEVAKADGSTGWCLGQGGGSAPVAAFMDRQPASALFGDRRTIISWGPGAGTAVEVLGGYRLTGKWPFASGSHHATWLGGLAKVVDPTGSPRLHADGQPETVRLLFPAVDAEFSDVWHVSGLRGTGSDSYAVSDLFVPRAYAVACNPFGIPRPEMRCETGPLYAFTLGSVFAIGFASVALGIARATLDAFIDLAGAKTPQLGSALLREDDVVQTQVARSEAGLRSARAFLHDAVQHAWALAGPDSTIPLKDRVLIRLAATHAIHTAASVVDTVYHAAGSTAIFISNPFERRLRDVLTIRQQIQGRQAHFKTTGQFFLGLDPDTALM